MIGIIPMAGHGARFSAAGYDTPKPLLPLRDRPLLYWAAQSLPLESVSKLVFVVLREHVENNDIINVARQHLSNLDLEFMIVDSVPNGQLMSVLAARDHLQTDAPIVIYNADTYTQAEYPKIVNLSSLPLGDRQVAGILVVFSAEGEHWSFARETSDGSVDLVAEKERISDLCSNGMYWFRSGREFIRCADKQVRDHGEKGEFYVAPVYNRLLEEGLRVEVERVSRVLSFGTPAEYVVSETKLADWLA